MKDIIFMEKNIYIKTEPGGRIFFGKMSEYDINLFKKSYLASMSYIDDIHICRGEIYCG